MTIHSDLDGTLRAKFFIGSSSFYLEKVGNQLMLCDEEVGAHSLQELLANTNNIDNMLVSRNNGHVLTSRNTGNVLARR